MQNLFAKMYFGEQCGQKNCTQGRDAVNFSFLGLPCICDLGGQGCKGNGSRWKGPFAWEVLQGLIAQSLKYVFRSDLWLSYMNRHKQKQVWPPPEHFLLGEKIGSETVSSTAENIPAGGYHHKFWLTCWCQTLETNSREQFVFCALKDTGHQPCKTRRLMFATVGIHDWIW